MDVGGSRQQAEEHHGIMLQERSGNGKGVRRAGRGRVPQFGRWEQHRRILQSRGCYACAG